MTYNAPDTQIAQAIASIIQRRMGYDPSSVLVASEPDVDPNWKNDPTIEVCPGEMKPYGGGDGSQDGAALLREQTFTVWVFYTTKLDAYSTSIMLLIEKETGILEIMEPIRRLFQLNALPQVANPNASQFYLIEPIKWKGEGKTEWESVELRILRRPMYLRVAYGVVLPDGPDIALSDYQ